MDVESLDADDSLWPKRKYRKKTNLSISQRKNYKHNIPVQLMPTVEFKSARQLRHEKRGKNIAGSSGCHSLQLHVPAEKTQWCLANPPIAPHSSADEAETDYYSDGDASVTPSSYVQACIRDLSTSNMLVKVLRKCEQQGVTRHFM